MNGILQNFEFSSGTKGDEWINEFTDDQKLEKIGICLLSIKGGIEEYLIGLDEQDVSMMKRGIRYALLCINDCFKFLPSEVQTQVIHMEKMFSLENIKKAMDEFKTIAQE